jgi:hypothetical protein
VLVCVLAPPIQRRHLSLHGDHPVVYAEHTCQLYLHGMNTNGLNENSAALQQQHRCLKPNMNNSRKIWPWRKLLYQCTCDTAMLLLAHCLAARLNCNERLYSNTHTDVREAGCICLGNTMQHKQQRHRIFGCSINALQG